MINPSNVFIFADLIVHHKGSVISNDLTQMVNFATRIPDCDSHSPARLDFFLSSDISICSAKAMAFPPFGNSDHVIFSVYIDFLLNSQWDAPFYHIDYDQSCAEWYSLHDHLRDVPWEDIFSASAAACDFCDWVQKIDVYTGLYLGFECNFSFLQMPYFGSQVTIWPGSAQPTLVINLPLQLESRESQGAVEHLKLPKKP